MGRVELQKTFESELLVYISHCSTRIRWQQRANGIVNKSKSNSKINITITRKIIGATAIIQRPLSKNAMHSRKMSIQIMTMYMRMSYSLKNATHRIGHALFVHTTISSVTCNV